MAIITAKDRELAKKIGQTGSAGADGGSAVEDYSDYLRQAHQAEMRAAVARLNAAFEQNMAAVDRAETGLTQDYRQARNQTAAAHEQEKRNFAQYAAANGLNSGTAGQAELARGITLQNNMNSLHAAEASDRADLALQRAQAESEYNAAIEQARYTGEHQLAAALYEEKVRLQQALTEQEIRRQKEQLEQYQLQYQAQRDAVADERYQSEQAFKLQQYRDSLALQQAQQALKERQQDYKEKQEENPAVTMSLATAKELAENGLLSDPVIATLNAHGYDKAAIQALYGEETDPAKLAATISQEDRKLLETAFPDGVVYDPLRWQWWTEKYGEEALNAAGYRYGEWDLPSSVYEALGMGHPEKAVARIDEIWDTLSAEQRRKTKEILAGYGYFYTP